MSYISAALVDEQVVVWERGENGERVKVTYPAPYYFYVSDPDGEFESIFGDKVSKLKFSNARDYYNVRRELTDSGIARLWESDIRPEVRVLSNRYYNLPAPPLNVTFLDIEVDYDKNLGFSSVRNPYAPINSIAMYHTHTKVMNVLCVPPPGQTWTVEQLFAEWDKTVPLPDSFHTTVTICKDEEELLNLLLSDIQESDVLSGWNSDFFDIPYIAKRIERTLGSHRVKDLCFPGALAPRWDEVEVQKRIQPTIRLSGRMSLDYMVLFKKYEANERHSYKLASIEEEVGLGLPKIEYSGSLSELYRENFPYFVRYNIRDSEILKGFEEVLGYIDVASQMYHISCGLAEHVQGTLKLAELAIVNYCHHHLKRVVPNITRPEIDRQIDGALVLLPQIGMHDYIGSIDINSLYPSSIMSLNISPEKIVGQFPATGQAHAAIIAKEPIELLFEYDSGKVEKLTAAEWHDKLIENKWAISGYGTVLKQDEPGIIPSVLSDWFKTRKKYQADKKAATEKATQILMKYMSEDEAKAAVSKQLEVVDSERVASESSTYDDSSDDEDWDEFG